MYDTVKKGEIWRLSNNYKIDADDGIWYDLLSREGLESLSRDRRPKTAMDGNPCSVSSEAGRKTEKVMMDGKT